mmetsp:Transcript_127272/g.368503  ORF Transcript_127272/g.368503 Transcript_127272/m.368503 type:complete len:227 (+) Transcript_127272:1353-2033(+)
MSQTNRRRRSSPFCSAHNRRPAAPTSPSSPAGPPPALWSPLALLPSANRAPSEDRAPCALLLGPPPWQQASLKRTPEKAVPLAPPPPPLRPPAQEAPPRGFGTRPLPTRALSCHLWSSPHGQLPTLRGTSQPRRFRPKRTGATPTIGQPAGRSASRDAPRAWLSPQGSRTPWPCPGICAERRPPAGAPAPPSPSVLLSPRALLSLGLAAAPSPPASPLASWGPSNE